MSTYCQILQKETRSDKDGLLQKVSYEFEDHKGKRAKNAREVYDRGDSAAAFLYDPQRKTVVLTRQFRLGAWMEGYRHQMLVEICAGRLEKNEAPESCIIREIEEETGYKVQQLQHIMSVFMSPAAFTEKLHLYAVPYHPAMKVSPGGGLASEHESIEVLEVPFEMALEMLQDGRIQDAKSVLMLQHAQLQGWMQ
jgi:nudix-type nucleoside diphosphatase (YffH/AdpP family)